jgi:hypothetical protein
VEKAFLWKCLKVTDRMAAATQQNHEHEKHKQ